MVFILDPAQNEVWEKLKTLQGEILNFNGLLRASFLKKLFKASVKIPKGLYIYGTVGRGKTTLMNQFYEVLPAEIKQRHHFHEFMVFVHHQISIYERDHTKDAWGSLVKDILKNGFVLCLDEFLVTNIADAMILKKLFSLIWQYGGVMVATSNTAPENLYLNGLHHDRFLPFVDVLRRHNEIIELKEHHDYRQENETSNSLNYSVGPKAFQILKEKVEKQCKDLQWEVSLMLEDVKIKTIAKGKDMVWFDFDSLCNQSLGSGEYLNIPEMASLVIITGIPIFQENLKPAFARFALLIDILYDKNIKLWIGAETPLKGLFSFDQKEREYERIYSRIVEMTSV